MKVASDAVGAVATRRAGSLTVIVRNEIERMIVSGGLGTGQRLNEQHLAAQLSVSRGPVWEALRALELGGHVTGVANLGMFVRHVGVAEAIELYKMRGVIFAFCCAKTTERTSATDKQEIAAMVGQMDETIEAGDRSAYYQQNLTFHDKIIELAEHGRAGQVYSSLVKEAHLFRQRSLQPIESMRNSNREHRDISDAIIAGDGAAARAAGEEHHLKGMARWLDTLAR